MKGVEYPASPSLHADTPTRTALLAVAVLIPTPAHIGPPRCRYNETIRLPTARMRRWRARYRDPPHAEEVRPPGQGTRDAPLFDIILIIGSSCTAPVDPDIGTGRTVYVIAREIVLWSDDGQIQVVLQIVTRRVRPDEGRLGGPRAGPAPPAQQHE